VLSGLVWVFDEGFNYFLGFMWVLLRMGQC
jgi:hypothetical protein